MKIKCHKDYDALSKCDGRLMPAKAVPECDRFLLGITLGDIVCRKCYAVVIKYVV